MKNVCRFCGETLQAEHYLDNGKPHTRFTCHKCQLQFSLPIVGLQSAKTFEGLARCPFCNASLSKDKLKTTLACNKCNVKLSSKDSSYGKGEVGTASVSGDENFKAEIQMNDSGNESDVVEAVSDNRRVIRTVSDESKVIRVVSDKNRVVRAVSDKSRAALKGFALKSTRAPTNPQIFDENLRDCATSNKIEIAASDQITLKSFALKSTRPPRNPQLFDENLEEQAIKERESNGMIGDPFCGTTEDGRDLLKLVKCAKKSKTLKQMLQTFFDRISAEIVNDVNLPSRSLNQEQMDIIDNATIVHTEENIEMVEPVLLPLKQQQVIYKSWIKNPLEEESGKHSDITSRLDQKITHKLPNKYKNSNLKKITKLKQRVVKSKKSNLLVPKIVQQNFEEGALKSNFEKIMELGDKSSFHKCAVCDKSFTKIGNLNVHMIIHTEEKPYKCPHCDRGFSHQSTLKSHILLHTGERPYSCSRCMYSCRQAGTLNKHTIKKHVNNW